MWSLALGALLSAGLLIGFFVWISLPDVRTLRSGWPAQTSYMKQRIQEAKEGGETLRLGYRPVRLSAIPKSVQRAVRVAEDAAFYDHHGFDWYELRDAIRRAWERKEAPRGASTITQQLARNLYLSSDRSYLRKLREALIARRLERQLEKRRILELYLNVIELGPGLFGVEAASRHYFGIPVSDVSERQAAMLAASIPAPRRDNPATDTRRFRWRTRLVYERAFAASDTADA